MVAAHALDLGLYTRADDSNWAASPITMPLKRNGEYRVCGDYVQVNEQVEADAGPMPDHRSKMSTFRGCHFFAIFDFENGYYQGPISERASFTYAIITPTGVYRPLRVPFGAKNAPIWFHNAVSRMFNDLPGVETCLMIVHWVLQTLAHLLIDSYAFWIAASKTRSS